MVEDSKVLIPAEVNVTLSPSKLRDYITCPYMFRKVHIEGQKFSKPNPALPFGSSIHAVLEEIYSPLSIGFQVDELRDCLARHWKEADFADQQESISYFTEAFNILTAYLKYSEPLKAEVIGTELFLNNNVRLDSDLMGRFSCKIDRLDRCENESLEVVDYKTNNNGEVPSRSALSTDLSSFLYYLLVRINYFSYQHVVVTFINVGSLKKVTIDYSDEERKANKQNLIQVAHRIHAGQFDPTPNITCQWCIVRKLCPALSREAVLSDF